MKKNFKISEPDESTSHYPPKAPEEKEEESNLEKITDENVKNSNPSFFQVTYELGKDYVQPIKKVAGKIAQVGAYVLSPVLAFHFLPTFWRKIDNQNHSFNKLNNELQEIIAYYFLDGILAECLFYGGIATGGNLGLFETPEVHPEILLIPLVTNLASSFYERTIEKYQNKKQELYNKQRQTPLIKPGQRVAPTFIEDKIKYRPLPFSFGLGMMEEMEDNKSC